MKCHNNLYGICYKTIICWALVPFLAWEFRRFHPSYYSNGIYIFMPAYKIGKGFKAYNIII
jgi:hypothetical protein